MSISPPRTPAWLLIPLDELKWEDLPEDVPRSKAVIVHLLRSLPYEEYLKTDHWKQVRTKAVRRALYRCELCGAGGILHVHHKSYERLGCEDERDVIALCPSCHETEHKMLKHCLSAATEALRE